MPHFNKDNAREIGKLGGRPVGSKDKKWQSIQAIWDMFIAEYPKLRPNEKSRYMLEIFKLHFERAIAQLPKDQSDSVLNAKTLLDEIQALEAKFESRTGSKSDTSKLADRPTEI